MFIKKFDLLIANFQERPIASYHCEASEEHPQERAPFHPFFMKLDDVIVELTSDLAKSFSPRILRSSPPGHRRKNLHHPTFFRCPVDAVLLFKKESLLRRASATILHQLHDGLLNLSFKSPRPLTSFPASSSTSPTTNYRPGFLHHACYTRPRIAMG